MRIPFGKSWRQATLLVGIGALLLLATLFASRQLLLPPLLERMINRHLQELGLSVSLRSVSGNLISSLTLEGVELTARQPHPLQHAAIAQIALHFNLLALRQGSDAFLTSSRIRILAPDCLLNQTIGLPAAATGTAASPLLGPSLGLSASLLPQLELHRGHLHLLGDGYETDFAAITLQTAANRITPESIPLALEIEKITFLRPDRQELSARFQGRMTITPTKVEIDSFQLGEQFLGGRGELLFPQESADDLAATLELSLAGVGNATLAARLGHGQLRASLAGHDLPLTPLLSAAMVAPPELDGTLGGQAQVTCALETFPACTGDVDLTLAAGHWRELKIDELELHAAVAPQALEVKQALLRSGEDHVSLTAATLPLAPLLAQEYKELLRQSTGDFELTLHHLPQLLTAAGLQLEEMPAAAPPAHTLQIAGRLQENVVTIPHGVLRIAAGEVSVRDGRFSLPPPESSLTESAVQGELLIDLPDLALFAPVLALPPLQGKIAATAKVNGPIHRLQGQAQITGSRLAYRGHPVGDLSAQGSADRERLQIESVTLVNSGDQLSGQATLPLTDWQKSQAKVSLTVRELASYRWLVPAAGDLSGGGELELQWRGGSWQKPVGEAKLQGHHLAVRGTAIGELRATIKGADGTLSWSALQLERGEDRLESHGQLRLTNQEFVDTVVTGKVADLGSYGQRFFPAAWTPAGPVHFQAKVGGKLADPQIGGQIKGHELRLHEATIDQFALTARYSRLRLTIDELRIETQGSTLAVSGWLSKESAREGYRAEITTLALHRNEHHLRLMEATHLELDGQKRWRLEPLLFQDGGSSLQIFGQGEEEHWQIKGTTHNLDSQGWLDLLVGNRLSFHGLEANFDLGVTPAGATLACQGNVAALTLDQQSGLAGSFDFTFDPQGFSFRKFAFQTKDGLQVNLNGRLPLNPWAADPFLTGPLALAATVNLPTLEPLRTLWPKITLQAGSLQATTNLSGSWRQPIGHLSFSGKELLLAEPFKTIHPLPLSLAGNLDFEQDTIRLQELQAFSAILDLRLSGLCTALPAVDDFLRGKVASMDGNLNLTGKLTVPELAKLGFQIPGMRRFGGRLTSDLTINGPLAAPTIRNIMAMSEGFLRPDWELPAFNEIKLAATLDWPTLQIQALQGEFGGAPFTIDGSIDCQTLHDPKFALHLLSDNLLIYRQPGLKLRGNADVDLTGPLSAVTLSGGVAITNSSFTEDVNYINLLLGSHRPKRGVGVELFSIKEKPFRDMIFDLKFTAKNPIKIKNNMASGGFRPNVKLLGSGELPLLAGDFFLDKTRVSLPTGQFTFESGIMRFPPDEPDRQLLDLTGTAQLLGYDVSVQVHGPYNDSVVTLTSNPSLPEEDLLLLVLTGKAPAQNLGSAVAQKSGMKVALYLGRNMLTKWFGGGSADSDQSILDRFELAIGRGLTQLGEDTIESQFRLAEGVFRPDDVLFLTADKDIYDAYNAGVKIVFRFP